MAGRWMEIVIRWSGKRRPDYSTTRHAPIGVPKFYSGRGNASPLSCRHGQWMRRHFHNSHAACRRNVFVPRLFFKCSEMPNVEVGCELNYDVHSETIFLFKIASSETSHQSIVSENLVFDPALDVENCQVGFEGNRLHRVSVNPCQLKVSYNASISLNADIDRPDDVQESIATNIPPEILTYMNPSRYCESDLLGRFAYEEFGSMPRGFGRVQAIADWVFNQLDYTPGSTTATTTAADVLLQRTGVCRDYAHLAIALCRGIGVPARYVSGYAVNLNPPDFHGFFEAFLDGQWYLFDPTRLSQTTGLVRIGVGLDAADVAFSTFTGSAALLDKSVWATMEDGPSGDNQAAVSTA